MPARIRIFQRKYAGYQPTGFKPIGRPVTIGYHMMNDEERREYWRAEARKRYWRAKGARNG